MGAFIGQSVFVAGIFSSGREEMLARLIHADDGLGFGGRG
jgi:hypothetical protein